MVEASFANFAPAMVARSIPDAWAHASPAAALTARSLAAADALRRLAPSVNEAAHAALAHLRLAVAEAPPVGRPLFAANRELAWPSDPVAELWQAATTLREHRGTATWRAWWRRARTAARPMCCSPRVRAPRGGPPGQPGVDRGGVAAATAGLQQAGLLDGAGVTEEGRAVRAAVEVQTDSLAAQAYRAWGDDDLIAVRQSLAPVAAEIVRSGMIPFPNPIRLPAQG